MNNLDKYEGPGGWDDADDLSRRVPPDLWSCRKCKTVYAEDLDECPACMASAAIDVLCRSMLRHTGDYDEPGR